MNKIKKFIFGYKICVIIKKLINEEAIYYEKIVEANHSKKTYLKQGYHSCKEDSISKEYIFYKEKHKWEIEEVAR